MARFTAYRSPTHEGQTDLKFVGEFDLSGRELADQAFEGARDASSVVLDLSELDFIDSTGVQFVIVAMETSRERGCDFKIVRGKPPVERVFSLLGLNDALPFVDGPGLAPSA